MGNTMSEGARLTGVPMPPTAWALASMWSAVWDAPRFRGHRVALRREALAPLLKIAASCVAALLPHVAPGDRNSRLPPYGASRELLVAALDQSPHGAALPDPTRDPEGFVRVLTKACFMTGDGTFVDGVSEEVLDQLLSERCATQLSQAALLNKDPSETLEAALDAAKMQVQELLGRPPPTGDLQAVADRLLLAQRLERLADEARELLEAPGAEEEPAAAAPAEAEEEEPEVVDMDVVTAPTDDTPAEIPRQPVEQPADVVMGEDSAPASDVQERDHNVEAAPTNATPQDEGEHNQDVLQRSKTVVSASSSFSPSPQRAPSPDAEGEQVLPRTKSQIAASVKVNKVKKHLDESIECVHELRRAASQLARKGTPPDGEIHALQAELETIDQARKRARNFGEDLVEDMLALDSLQNLGPEDRSTRKAAIAGIESLLQDVDAAKARLNSLHESIKAKLEAAQAKREAVREPSGDDMSAGAAASPVPRRRETSASGHPHPKRAAIEGLAIEAPPPKKEKWREVRLPLRFHSREEGDHYTILASVPGLDTEELKLELGDDEKTLTVQGLRVPTPQEALRMQQKISAKLRMLAERAPQRFASVQKNIPRIAEEAYVELGQDEYGLFSETFRVPSDVDVGKIEASYRDGVLRIILPRVAPEPPPLLYDTGRGGRYASGRPSRGYPQAFPNFMNGQVPLRGPPLFGGLDRGYMW